MVGERVGIKAWKGRPGLGVMLLCSDSAQMAYLLVREGNWWHHACVSAQHKMAELLMVESKKSIGCAIVNTRDVLQTEVKIVLHAKHGQ